MSSPVLQRLQHVLDSAKKSESVEDGVKHLSSAFSLFSKETKHLEAAYSKLQKRFKDVKLELERSHRKLEEKIGELDLSTHYLNSILRHINQGILVVGLDGMITTYNSAAEKILGISYKSMIFQEFWEVFPDGFFNFSMREALKSAHPPKVSSMTYQEKEIEIDMAFVRKGHQSVIIMLRDVTEMRRLQKEARRKVRMEELGEMAASVAHEIRNPLGGIQGFASLLHRDLKDEKMKEMAHTIIEGSKRLSLLAEDVLQYARPLQLHKEPVDLCALFDEIERALKVDPQFPKRVRLKLQLPQNSLLFICDKELLRSALLNLIWNGAQAMPKGGPLTVRLKSTRGRVILSIMDTGLGIEPKHLEKIFTPFFTTKEKGNGLGLCEACKIVEAHLGTIEVSSERGKGTTFTLLFPLRG